MPHVNCKRTASIRAKAAMCKAINAGGQPAFDTAKAAYNAFIGQLAGSANAVVAVIKPVLELDKIVIDTFVRPPLNLTVKALDTTVKTLKVPLAIIGGSNQDPHCKQFHSGIRRGADKVAEFLGTRDFNKLKNKADELDEWLGDRTELIEDLEAMAEVVSELAIEEDYEEFVNDICPTISQ